MFRLLGNSPQLAGAPLLLLFCLLATPSLTAADRDDYDYDYDSSAVRTTGFYLRMRVAHATVGCATFALVFPLGGLLLRLLPGPKNIAAHVGLQLAGFVAALATMGMGLYMAIVSDQFWEPRLSTAGGGRGVLSSSGQRKWNYHTIIGLLAVGCLVIQPATGWWRHRQALRDGGQTRRAMAWAHVVWGVAVITLGIVNGGLGLQFGGQAQWIIVVYGVVAGVIWVGWTMVTLLSVARKRYEDEDGIERGSATAVGKKNSEDGTEGGGRSTSRLGGAASAGGERSAAGDDDDGLRRVTRQGTMATFESRMTANTDAASNGDIYRLDKVRWPFLSGRRSRSVTRTSSLRTARTNSVMSTDMLGALMELQKRPGGAIGGGGQAGGGQVREGQVRGGQVGGGQGQPKE